MKKTDNFRQIRYSSSQFDDNCLEWMSDYGEIMIFLDNNHIEIDNLPTISEYLESPINASNVKLNYFRK